MTKTALISDATGQDGAYLAEFLPEEGYVAHGIKRRASHGELTSEMVRSELPEAQDDVLWEHQGLRVQTQERALP